MSFRDKVKKHTPKVDLQSYTLMIVGGWKCGKTRAWKEIIELHYPNQPEAGLLLAFEPGYKSWELDSFIDMHNYDWDFFRSEVVPGLVQEMKDGTNTKVIGFDTIDRMTDMATTYVLKELSKKYAKNFTSISEIGKLTKNADNGYIELSHEMNKQLDLLKNAGYGLFWLGWTKEKETELIDGMKYQSLEMSLPNTGRKIFESQADLICCLYPEVKVLDKEGEVLEENIINNKGKEIASKFHSTEMYMYFRSNNYINISGGRFLNLPEKVPYSADNFLKVFENAVKGQLKNTSESVEELKAKENIERKEIIEKVVLEEKTIEELTEVIKEISIKLKDDGMSKTELGKIIGRAKYTTIEQAQEVLNKLNEINTK